MSKYTSSFSGDFEESFSTVLEKTDKALSVWGKQLPEYEEWSKKLALMLILLGDAVNNTNSSNPTSSDLKLAQQAYLKLAPNGVKQETYILHYIYEWRSRYCWKVLKQVIRCCPGFPHSPNETKHRVQLTDIFNILDMHIQEGKGFRLHEMEFAAPEELLAAKNCLSFLLNSLFYIDWQVACQTKQDEIQIHYDFAKAIAESNLKKSIEARESNSNWSNKNFYLAETGFISMNYDPIALWAQFLAHKHLNENPPEVGLCGKRFPVKLFHDYGIPLAIDRIGEKGEMRYAFGEPAAQRFNDPDNETGKRVVISKFLFPHGCVCWRECPNCGKMSCYFGDEWELLSTQLIPRPSLLSDEFERDDGSGASADHLRQTSASNCLHCGRYTNSEHIPTIMQSNFKQAPSSFIQEIQRDMKYCIESAKHIILIGYSLPPDDVTYRAILAAKSAASRMDKTKTEPPVTCTAIGKYGNTGRWFTGEEMQDEIKKPSAESEQAAKTTMQSIIDIFGVDNVRYYGGGFPEVVTENNQISGSKVETLLNFHTAP